MKQIKKVVLKDATRLSLDEMKLIFGGSGTNEGTPSGLCYISCNDLPFIKTTDDCPKGCLVNYKDQLICKAKKQTIGYQCVYGSVHSSIISSSLPNL